MIYHNPEQETLTRSQLTALQDRRLKDIIRHVYTKNAVFRKRLEEAGVHPDTFRGLEELEKIPTMNKKEFREHFPLGMCCVDEREIREVHQSSGTSGTPVVMPYTAGDLAQWAECMARCYCMAGAVPGDVCQITPSFGMFNGGFGMYHGARAANLFIVPASAGNTERQIRMAQSFGTKILTAVVSYGPRILEVMAQMNATLPTLKIGIFGAEMFSDNMKKMLAEGFGIDAFDIYGMTESGGVGTLGQDCPEHAGIHVWEDHYVVEILKPGTHEVVPDGELGEVTVTSLTREALPVLRFRTGDLSRIVSREKCGCGRTHVRIAPVTGRLDDMLIIKGVNFFPSQVEQALLEIPGVHPHYQIIIEDHHGVKDVHVNVEAEEGVTGYMVEKKLKETLGFSPKGDVYQPGQLPRQAGKAQRVFYQDDPNA
ncbi:MAG: phenylacetate--CoA ligase [Planctomycetia bacterium]|nr:phenylacetate--CoA ligase [Planctomycetia bacterium]